MAPRQILKTIIRVFFPLIFVFSWTYAHAETSRIIDGRTGNERSFEQFLETIPLGAVVLIGEQHAYTVHQQEQLQVLKNAQERGHLVSVGMEFFSYPFQDKVDSWRNGELSEGDFLKAISWGGMPFSSYRPQVLVPRLGQEFLWALNMPMSLTGKVAKDGLDSLSAEEASLMPPQFQIGNDRYFERFKSAGHWSDPSKLKNYFTAQSIWDDTMAWKAVQFHQKHPEQTLFIIVGEFHVQYGGGLPDRLRARGAAPVVTLSLVNADGMTPDEELEAISPTEDGRRADFIWVSRP